MGNSHFDPGGRFAVKGSHRGLIGLGDAENPYYRRALPPRLASPRRCARNDFWAMPCKWRRIVRSWSSAGFCSVRTCFIAEMIGYLGPAPARGCPVRLKYIVTRRRQQNGMLLREIGRLVKAPLTPGTTDLHMPVGSSGNGIASAFWPCFTWTQIPASHTAISKPRRRGYWAGLRPARRRRG